MNADEPTIGERIDALGERVGEIMSELDAQRQVIIRLRKALRYYADPETGWAETDHADAYEESRELVPFDRSEEQS